MSNEESRSDTEPPVYAQIQYGIYFLANKATRAVIDLPSGKANHGQDLWGCWRQPNGGQPHQLWLIRSGTREDTYTLENITAGMCLDMGGGRYTRVHIRKKSNGTNQTWSIEQDDSGYFRIRNVATSQSLGFSSIDNQAPLMCSDFDGDPHGLWKLERISRNKDEILSILANWDENAPRNVHSHHSSTTQFFTLGSVKRREIWHDTGILRQPLRAGSFGYAEAALLYKTASASWLREHCRADCVSCLCGVVYGSLADDSNVVFNWYLSEDAETLIFFDPLFGTEHTVTSMVSMGFKLSMGIF